MLALVAVAAGLAWLAPGPRAWTARQRADQAWEVRRGSELGRQAEALREEGQPEARLARARALYLQGRFLDCLDELPEGEDELREQAEDALLVDARFPSTVLLRKRLGEGGPGGDRRDLARVLEDGEDRFLEVFGFRNDHHRRLDLELVDPSGRSLRDDRLQRLPVGVEPALEAHRLGDRPALRLAHERDGSHLLDLGLGTARGMRIYRFRAERPPVLEGREVSLPGRAEHDRERWRWDGEKFLRR